MLKQHPPLAGIATPGDLFSSDSALSTNVQIAVAYKPGEPHGDGLTLHAGSCKVRDVELVYGTTWVTDSEAKCILHDCDVTK